MYLPNDVDLERCVAISIEQSKDCQASSKSDSSRCCTIAVQHLDGRAVLINATINVDVDGGLVFSSAKKQISQALSESWHQRLIGKLFMGLIVGTARIKQVYQFSCERRFEFFPFAHNCSKVIHCGPRSNCPGLQGPRIPPSRVYLQDFALDPLLTEAFHNSHLLLRSAAYPLWVDSFGSSPAGNVERVGNSPARLSNDTDGRSTSACIEQDGPVDSKSVGNCIEHDGPVDKKSPSTCIEHGSREVIVVRHIIDRTKVAWLLLLLLFFSPALGIGVGICSHNADVGIAVSAGVFALASFVQGLVAWIQG